MNNLFFIALTLFCVFLTGCERTIIEANKITCHEDNYESHYLMLFLNYIRVIS